jgi:alpha-D-ribose 1-methylphosphonate 5-triphosphate synthase subunit PhnI
MGYAAARGGIDAIVAAEDLVRRERDEVSSPKLETGQLLERLGLAVDRVVGEGGLWAPELAAFALRQTEGDVIEAVHLLRAFRSTLPRVAHGLVVEMAELEILRRIVPAYRTPPGPQLLGRTLDYVGRILDTGEEGKGRPEAARAEAEPEAGLDEPAAVAGLYAKSVTNRPKQANSGPPTAQPANGTRLERHPGRLLNVLASLDLLVDHPRDDDPEPFDITAQPVRPGLPRSAILSVMARAETGALVNLWYRNVLGPDGYIHEITLGEVRHGRVPVRVLHPHTERPVTIGTVRVTEVEAIEDLNGPDEQRDRFDVGYGLCFGHNERKAIAMANLDISVRRDQGATMLEQSVIMTTDGLDASGFLEHLKLPHYVTFRSMVDRKRAVRAASEVNGRAGTGSLRPAPARQGPARAAGSPAGSVAANSMAGGDCADAQPAGSPALPLGAAE